MQLKLYCILLLLLIVNFSEAQPTAPVGKTWKMLEKLSDEFNANKLDDNKWIPKHTFWEGREPSAFKTENVSVLNGNLQLKSTVANREMQGIWVNAACVSSKTKAMKKGYYSEARILCPSLSMTGAYWFQGKYSEIDVIENFGAPTAKKYAGHEYRMKTNLHYFAQGWKKDIDTPWEDSILTRPCDQQYYTYGVWWKDENTVIFYLDGKEVHTSKTGGEFNEKMYMYFDMETFTWGVGLPTLESLDDPKKNTQYVDWVHTYRLVKE